MILQEFCVDQFFKIGGCLSSLFYNWFPYRLITFNNILSIKHFFFVLKFSNTDLLFMAVICCGIP